MNIVDLKNEISKKNIAKVKSSLEKSFGINSETYNSLIGNDYQKRQKAMALLYKNYEKKDDLRDFQFEMLKILSETEKNDVTKSLIPFYFEPAKIILYYDLESMKITIFFIEKYKGEKTYDERHIISHIVKVDGFLDFNLKSYSAIPTYMVMAKNKLLKVRDEATRISEFIPTVTVNSWIDINNNYKSELFSCVLDNGHPKYVTNGIIDRKLNTDLATVHFSYLREYKFDKNNNCCMDFF